MNASRTTFATITELACELSDEGRVQSLALRRETVLIHTAPQPEPDGSCEGLLPLIRAN